MLFGIAQIAAEFGVTRLSVGTLMVLNLRRRRGSVAIGGMRGSATNRTWRLLRSTRVAIADGRRPITKSPS